MSNFAFSFVMLGGMLGLMALRIPIAVAMLATGMTGYIMISGWVPLISHLQTAPFATFSTYSLSVIPLFLLMGEFATNAGMSKALFRAANTWLGHRRGGIAMAAVGGCAGFGAICGSSLATAATMAQVALPEMKRYRYSGALSTASLACGGTLGILIPPSVILVVYAIMTEQSIGKLFIAAILPACLAVAGYMTTIAIVVRRNPEAGPAGPKTSVAERLQSIKDIWAVALIFILVIGGIYRGWFTPTEGAAVGTFGTGMLAFLHGKMRWEGFLHCVYGAARSTAMIFLILLGAEIFNSFLALTRMPVEAARMISESGFSPFVVLLLIMLLYLVLGCVMDSMSMILLTIPIFYPIISVLDFGLPPEETAIWFGIIAVIVVEVGLITPPVGMNVFIINSFAKDVPMSESFRGVFPFLLSDFTRIAILVAFPSITLALVRLWG
jgi:tripartite ATP-independent transporter DctM subunit